MAALTTLSIDLFKGPSWTAFYKQLGGTSRAQKTVGRLSTAAAPTAAYGIDTALLVQFDLAASGTSTIDLTSYTDIVGQTTQSMARWKGMFLWLFGTADSTAQTPVTANPSALVIGAAASNPASLMFATPATDSLSVKPGSVLCYWDPGASGVTVDSTHKSVLLTNSDATNRAIGRLLMFGGLS